MEVNGLQQVFSIFFPKYERCDPHTVFLCRRQRCPSRPLTTEEERDLLSRMGTGDEKVRSTLIEHNLRLRWFILPAALRIPASILKTLYPLALLVSLRQ